MPSTNVIIWKPYRGALIPADKEWAPVPAQVQRAPLVPPGVRVPTPRRYLAEKPIDQSPAAVTARRRAVVKLNMDDADPVHAMGRHAKPARRSILALAKEWAVIGLAGIGFFSCIGFALLVMGMPR